MVKRVVPVGLRGEKNEYTEYLETDHWKNTRNSALLIARYRCKECKSTDSLEVHHLHYNSLGEENVLTDLIVLCAVCHQKKHPANRRGGWKRTQAGNWVRFLRDGECITVFQREPNHWESWDPEWSYVFGGEFSAEKYGSAQSAIAAAERDLL